MELRKQKEIEYYDKQAEKWSVESPDKKWQGDFEGFNPHLLRSYSFCYYLLEKYFQDKKILDYGCGNGVHSIFLAKLGKEVVGIDLSQSSLRIAKERAKRAGFEGKTEFLVMDCENTQFSDNSFDAVFDGGTFSSLDIKKALPELARILKPGGSLIGIETFGHNPLVNLKRRLNKRSGKRTEWAAEHIVRMKNLEEAKKYFDKTETNFFHLVSWIVFPLLRFPGFNYLLKLFERGDRMLLKLPFLKKYAFKIVFIFSSPKKND
jgi:ubiquinone/menaquinone biosynthesis C-methylase UbiE